MRKEKTYFSYLLRVWQTSSDGEIIWRASLETPGSGKRQGFASLADLSAFLQTLDDAREPRLDKRDGGGDETSS